MSKALSNDNLKLALSENNKKVKEWVESKIKNVIGISWVDALPVSDISTSTIYMLKKNASSGTTGNLYDEYVYNEITGWESLGQVDLSSIDLSDYYTKDEIDNLIKTEAYTPAEITAMINEIWS